MIDYRERTIVRKNRPRASGGSRLLVWFMAGAVVSYGLGLGSGWYLFGHGTTHQPAAVQGTPSAIPAAGRQAFGAATSSRAPQFPPAAGAHAELPLTFYETLPKGAKVPLGSGINPVPREAPVQSQPVSPPIQTKPPRQKPEEPPSSSSPKPHDQPGTVDIAASRAPNVAAQKKFAVQVASCQTRKEAEEMKARLVSRGHQAYVVESAVPGKGTWYRVKVGKGLDAARAKDMAGKLGKEALVVPE